MMNENALLLSADDSHVGVANAVRALEHALGIVLFSE